MQLRFQLIFQSFCAAMAAKYRLCACTVSEANGMIDVATTRLVADTSGGDLAFCSSTKIANVYCAPRNGYYLFAKGRSWLGGLLGDNWIGGNEMHSLCTEKYGAGASVCFDPTNAKYDDESYRDFASKPCLT
ncbi:m6 protein [Teratosphaeria destructans]|uniref:M6 protein n=1 Tax=Teratosphaeria destructans TaxID=418781 RepID=A0A9W7SL33_9PEZI|nr:m6 protein [Teratosphaeria destructans]